MQVIDRKFLDVKTQTCHAATIAFHNDVPYFAWFGGEREGLPDSSIYLQYNGTSERILGSNTAHWNPILFKVKDELFLAYKVGRFCDCWQTYIINITEAESIKDFNEIERQILPAGLNFAVKTKPIVDENGFVYCGSSVETSSDWSSYCEVYAYDEYTKGKFEYDFRSEPLTVDKVCCKYSHPVYGIVEKRSLGIIQPSLWIDSGEVRNAFFRSARGLGKIYHSYLEDDGVTENPKWSKPKPTEFDNPNSGVDTVYYKDRLFLVYNPSQTKRYPLVINELNENFDVVEELIVQEKVELPLKIPHSPELSYPYMVEHDGKLHLVYTYGRVKLEYVTIGI